MAAALSRALPSSVSASSTTSGTSGGRGTSSTTSPRMASISATLSGLAEAHTRRGFIGVAGGTDTISACRSASSVSPSSARPSSWSSSPRVNAIPSAVPCTSTKRASPPATGRSMTTFMSTSALLSST